MILLLNSFDMQEILRMLKAINVVEAAFGELAKSIPRVHHAPS